MTSKAIKEQAESMKKYTRAVIFSKKSAKKFLASTGIYTLKGNLKKHFK